MDAGKTKRRQKKLNELETVNPNCEICGHAKVTSLKRTALSVNQIRLLEKHHISGGGVGETITVCLNCHAKLSDDQADWPEGTLSSNRTPEMEAIASIRGRADVLNLIAEYDKKDVNTISDYVNKHQKYGEMEITSLKPTSLSAKKKVKLLEKYHIGGGGVGEIITALDSMGFFMGLAIGLIVMAVCCAIYAKILSKRECLNCQPEIFLLR